MIRVQLEGLLKRQDRVAVIDRLTLDLPPGELAFILGPAGAGKSLLGRLLAGLERLDDGEIYLDGRAVHALPTDQRGVGLLLPDDLLWPERTVADNIGYGLSLRGVRARGRRERVAEVASRLRLDGLLEARARTLAPGARKRVALARAVVLDPAVVVLDEPFAGLDTRARQELRDDLRRLHLEAETSLLVLTADATEALCQADRLAVMDLGRIVQVGAPAEVYGRPVDALVAQLTGAVNLIQGHVEPGGARGDVVVRTPLGRLVGTSRVDYNSAAPVTLAVRPEAIGLGPGVPPGANRFPATVERQVFLGQVRQVHLRGPGSWPVQAVVLQGQCPELRDGQVVTASIAPGHVVVLSSRLGGVSAERTSSDDGS